ncbi:hypothetical protein HHK36_018647 [Tetracentron sinense]|uniref:Peroxidase n=1 Tax=Tetracentron sinense TaxID=13715 RepID=A0A835DE80_TETSI|nr:hypothetical protein HHK36_018647 [Tetracentron sinense]
MKNWPRKCYYINRNAELNQVLNASPSNSFLREVMTSFYLAIFLFSFGMASAQLSSNFYSSSCPSAISTIKSAVTSAVSKEHRMGASLLRLHFHDCFVNASLLLILYCLLGNEIIFKTVSSFWGDTYSLSLTWLACVCLKQGCDASILLDDTSSFTGEKTASPNDGSARGFDVIDTIKSKVETVCPGVVSCADILAVAARDSVVSLGGNSWTVELGRRDSTTASLSAANSDLPSPTMDLSALISSFSDKGFSAKEMVALSGSHTIGQARCKMFRDRIYNEANINSSFATSIQSKCPSSGGDDNLSPLDATSPIVFDNAFYKNLLKNKGLLHSDQQLFNGGSTDSQVTTYSTNSATFFDDFASAMVKMSNLSPLTGTSGQIRTNCRSIN